MLIIRWISSQMDVQNSHFKMLTGVVSDVVRNVSSVPAVLILHVMSLFSDSCEVTDLKLANSIRFIVF